VAEPVFVCVT